MTVRLHISQIHPCCECFQTVFVLQALRGPAPPPPSLTPTTAHPLTLKALLMSRVYIRDARRQLAEQLMKQVRRWLHTVIAVTHTHTHPHTQRSVVNQARAALGGYGGHTCVRMCIYSSWWLMRGKSRWVKTTSVRCNVCEVIIYGLCTKLPSNSALFTAAITYREMSTCTGNLG